MHTLRAPRKMIVTLDEAVYTFLQGGYNLTTQMILNLLFVARD